MIKKHEKEFNEEVTTITKTDALKNQKFTIGEMCLEQKKLL